MSESSNLNLTHIINDVSKSLYSTRRYLNGNEAISSGKSYNSSLSNDRYRHILFQGEGRQYRQLDSIINKNQYKQHQHGQAIYYIKEDNAIMEDEMKRNSTNTIAIENLISDFKQEISQNTTKIYKKLQEHDKTMLSFNSKINTIYQTIEDKREIPISSNFMHHNNSGYDNKKLDYNDLKIEKVISSIQEENGLFKSFIDQRLSKLEKSNSQVNNNKVVSPKENKVNVVKNNNNNLEVERSETTVSSSYPSSSLETLKKDIVKSKESMGEISNLIGSPLLQKIGAEKLIQEVSLTLQKASDALTLTENDMLEKEKKCNDLMGKVNKLQEESERNGNSSKNLSIEANVNTNEEIISKFEKLLKDHREELSMSEKKNNKLTFNMKQMNDDINALSINFSDLEKENARLLSEVGVLKSKLKQASSDKEKIVEISTSTSKQLENETLNVSSDLMQLQSQYHVMESQFQNTTNLYEMCKNGNKELLSNINRLETEIENLKGSKLNLNRELAKTLETCKTLTESNLNIKSDQEKLVTSLNIDYDHKLQSVQNAFTEKIKQNLEESEKIKLKASSLENQVNDLTFIVDSMKKIEADSQEYIKKKNSELLALEQKNRSLEASCKDLESSLKVYLSNEDKLKESIALNSQLKGQFDDLTREKNEIEKDLRVKNSSLSAMELKYQQLNNNNNSNISLRIQTESTLGEYADNNKILTSKLKVMENSMKVNESLLRGKEEEVTMLNNKLQMYLDSKISASKDDVQNADSVNVISSMKILNESLEAGLKASEINNSRKSQELDSLRNQIAKLMEDNSNLQKKSSLTETENKLIAYKTEQYNKNNNIIINESKTEIKDTKHDNLSVSRESENQTVYITKEIKKKYFHNENKDLDEKDHKHVSSFFTKFANKKKAPKDKKILNENVYSDNESDISFLSA